MPLPLRFTGGWAFARSGGARPITARAMEAGVSAVSAAAVKAMSPSVTRPQETVNQGNVPAVVHAAMQQQLAVAPAARAAILERVKAIHTRAQAREYLLEVRQMTRPAKSASQGS